VLAAGCGGDEESPQAQWASEFCGALSTWKSSLTTIGTDFSGGISKDVISQKLDDAEQATNELVDDLQQIGPPETESGDEVKADLDQFADDAQSSISKIKSQANSLADASATGFLAGASAIAGEISTLLDSARTTLEQVQELDPQGELSEALQDDQTCQDLTET